jgi:hypothetical protein
MFFSRGGVSGIHEIGLITLIVLALFFLPRLGTRRRPAPRLPSQVPKKRIVLSGKWRAALLATVLWPIAAAAFFTPWDRDGMPFILVGVLPVLAVWGIAWVLAGFKKK